MYTLKNYLKDYFGIQEYVFKENMKVNIWERYWLPWYSLLQLED